MEEWREVEGYHGKYEASSLGRIRSRARSGPGGVPAVLYPCVNSHGYLGVTLCLNGIKKQTLVHRVVAATFIPNEENKKWINHKNGNKVDNRVVNIEWCTPGENMSHAYANGLNTGRRGVKRKTPFPTYEIQLNNGVKSKKQNGKKTKKRSEGAEVG